MNNLGFNPQPPNVMWIDINSCFATIEQQANPLLRGKPVAVAAFPTPRGCILAASVEAKKLGIKTGMRVAEGRAIYPKLVVLSPDPAKYRAVHLKLRRLLETYSPEVIPKSIDEFSLKLKNSKNQKRQAIEIKQKIKEKIGDYLMVSVGIAPNRYLAKIAAGLQKPDGLVEINQNNFWDIYVNLKLTDLTGIKERMKLRLNCLGIQSVFDLYHYEKPIYGIWWYLRLRGYEVDDFQVKRRSFSNEIALKLNKMSDVSPIVVRLAEKALSRARAAGYRAQKGQIFISERKIAVSFSDLVPRQMLQLDLWGKNIRQEKIEEAIDKINKRWGPFTIGAAKGFQVEKLILDRISFNQIADL